MTRQEKIDSINAKMAHTEQTEMENVVKICPVMIGDVLHWNDKKQSW
jgi:hypothetical protein